MAITLSGSLILSGSIEATGGVTISGSIASASYAENASTASYVANAVSSSYSLNALTSSNAMTASSADTLYVRNNVTALGSITAQTLIVQTVTSSVLFSTGSNKIGSSLTNTQELTGSVGITGSLSVNTNGTEFQVSAGGVNIGNALTDNHVISGSVTINPNGLFVSSSGIVGIGTSSPTGNANSRLHINGVDSAELHLTRSNSGISATFGGYVNFDGSNNFNLQNRTGGAINLIVGTTTALAITSTSTATFSNTETTFNFNPQTNLLAGYYYLNFGGGSIMYRNTTDVYIGSNGKYGSAGLIVAKYTSANGMGLLTMDGGMLRWQANNTSVTAGTTYTVPVRFAINGDGNVGIGTTSPSNILHVAQSNTGNIGIAIQNTNASYAAQVRFLNAAGSEKAAVTYVQSASALRFNNNTYDAIEITSGGGVDLYNPTTIGKNTNAGSCIGFTENQIYRTGNGVLYLQEYSTNHIVALNGGGNLLLGTSTNLGYKLFANGSAGGLSNWNNVSDGRLKKDITPVLNGLDKIKQLNGVYFNWDKTLRPDLNLDGNNHLGLIAQDVEAILPQVVTTGDDEFNTKTIAYSDIVPVLIEAIKELSTKNTSLEERLAILENAQ